LGDKIKKKKPGKRGGKKSKIEKAKKKKEKSPEKKKGTREKGRLLEPNVPAPTEKVMTKLGGGGRKE